MQVYADLRILTARPSAEEESRAPHRLFGHIDGADSYSAARWAEEARGAIHRAHAAGKLPILVGGTGLYMRTLLDGIAPVPEIDPDVRSAVRALPVEQAYAALRSMDPLSADKLGPTDTVRISRALEVIRSTGRPLRQWQDQREGGIGAEISLTAMILLPDRAWLADRIDRRFAIMAQEGAEEVRALLQRRDIPADAPLLRAIGVAELSDWMEGKISLEEATQLGATATRQYAKRQYTWFRRQPPESWQRNIATDMNDMMNYFETKLRQ